jgi:hypothetical protein
MKHMEIESKCATREGIKRNPCKKNKEKAHAPCKFRPSSDKTRAQGHSRTHLRKVVARQASRGVAAPTATGIARPTVSLAVAWWHAKAV